VTARGASASRSSVDHVRDSREGVKHGGRSAGAPGVRDIVEVLPRPGGFWGEASPRLGRRVLFILFSYRDKDRDRDRDCPYFMETHVILLFQTPRLQYLFWIAVL
jgi:hypothetical protein